MKRIPFLLSLRHNLPVTFKIEKLEGKLSSNSDTITEDRRPELYVECALYLDGAPFGLSMRTRLESSGPTYCWSELITLSIKYRDLTHNSQLALTVWDVSCGKNESLIGGATICLFNGNRQLKTGENKLRLWLGQEGDGSIDLTTPGKVPKEERGELEHLEKLMNKYDRGQIQRIEGQCYLKLQEKFRLDLDDEECIHFFQGLINESVSALFPQMVETFHYWAQYWC